MKLLKIDKHTKIYYTSTNFLFDISKEISRYNYVIKLSIIFNKLFKTDYKSSDLLYWSLIIGNDINDPLITKANIKIFNLLELPLNKLNIWNKYIDNYVNKINNKIIIHKFKYDIIDNNNNNNNQITILCLINNKTHKYKLLKIKYNLIYILQIIASFLRYESLNFLSGLSGGIDPAKYKNLNKVYNANVELFSSYFNSTLPYYFGLFYDLEHQFGCLGNYFKSKIKKGFYVANPPFENKIMNLFFDKAICELSKYNIAIYITLPCWDIKDREKLNKLCINDKLLSNNYNDLFNINILNIYTIINYLFCKSKYFYFDYLQNKFINFVPTNVRVICSDKFRIKLNNINYIMSNMHNNAIIN